MDTTLEYALMMKVAKEITDVWEFSNGDWFFSQDRNNPLSWGVTVWVDSFHLAEDTRCVIPLPRQDQLQDMVIDAYRIHWQDSVMMGLMEEVVAWGKQLPYETMEQCWLCFVMHHNHSKVWDGSEWVSA